MKVRVRLVAMDTVRPEEETSVEVAEGATVEAAVDALRLRGAESYMTLVNGAAVPVGERATVRLGADDELTIFPPIKGG